MTSIMLRDVCLDYIVPGGVNSLGKIAVQLFQRAFLGKRPSLQKHTTYRALHDINLSVKTGDRVGIIGKNGAGKSSLLRVLAKIYRPFCGQVMINGKISTIFDVFLGLNHEMTGYENITNLGIMRGFSKKEAQAMIEDVADFTCLGAHLQNPVKTYSAGMQMKLTFAVATACSPEILLIDEMIGVGDAFFMEQAFQRLNRTVSQSQILMLATHSNDIIRQFCTKAIVMEQGQIRYFGPVDEAIAFYMQQDAMPA